MRILFFLGLFIVGPVVHAEHFDRSFQTSDRIRLHYIESGEGPTIALVPGWSMPAAIWQPQLDTLSNDFRVIALDPRSQGESEVTKTGLTCERRAQDIHEWLAHANVKDAVLVGWSLGGFEAMCYLKLFGAEYVRAVVLVDHSIGEGPPGKPSGLSKSFQQNPQQAMDDFVRNMFKSKQSEAYLDRLTGQCLRTPVDVGAGLLANQWPRESWSPILRDAAVPILYAITARYQDQASALKKIRPDAQVELFPDAGHALFVDEADHFNRTLKSFIRGLHAR